MTRNQYELTGLDAAQRLKAMTVPTRFQDGLKAVQHSTDMFFSGLSARATELKNARANPDLSQIGMRRAVNAKAREVRDNTQQDHRWMLEALGKFLQEVDAAAKLQPPKMDPVLLELKMARARAEALDALAAAAPEKKLEAVQTFFDSAMETGDLTAAWLIVATNFVDNQLRANGTNGAIDAQAFRDEITPSFRMQYAPPEQREVLAFQPQAHELEALVEYASQSFRHFQDEFFDGSVNRFISETDVSGDAA